MNKPFDLEAVKLGESFTHVNDRKDTPYKFVGVLSTGEIVIEHDGKPIPYPVNYLRMLPKKVFRLKWKGDAKVEYGQVSAAIHQVDFDTHENASKFTRLLNTPHFTIDEVEV